MNHQDTVIALVEKTDYTATEVNMFLSALSKVMVESLGAGRDVRIMNLGLFGLPMCGYTSTRNRHTGERIIVPPRHRLRFVPAEPLKTAAARGNKLLQNKPYKTRFLPKEKSDGKVRSADRSKEAEVQEGEASRRRRRRRQRGEP